MVSRRIGVGLVLIFVILAVLWLFNTVLDNPIKTAGVVNNPDETGGVIEATENIIEITANGFSPKELTISVGETVRWINKDTEEHWPRSDKDTGFDVSEEISPGESWSFIFNEVGSWEYHDNIVDDLFGKIIVE